MNTIEFGDCREIMKRWATEGVKVQTCITSPPYYGLRDYGTGVWSGGDPSCSHKRDSKYSDKTITGHADKDLTVGDAIYKSVCPKCGAIRADEQLGLEETVEEYITAIVGVFKQVWNVLADDGTLWLNLGDSYYNYRPGKGQSLVKQTVSNNEQDLPQSCARRGNKQTGLKEKDLIGIPWRVALALQADGWYLRQDIIWHKPNPMPESVRDRCTKSHEYVFLLTKKSHYYFDNESIKEPVKQDWGTRDRTDGKYHNEGSGLQPHSGLEKSYEMANKRSVWSVNPSSYKGAHFATFPTKLIEPMILAGSRVGDIVLDPFMGSGTTGFVAEALGRKYLGCELNPDYQKLQHERLRQTSLELL
jgi:DNA modification methylase